MDWSHAVPRSRGRSRPGGVYPTIHAQVLRAPPGTPPCFRCKRDRLRPLQDRALDLQPARPADGTPARSTAQVLNGWPVSRHMRTGAVLVRHHGLAMQRSRARMSYRVHVLRGAEAVRADALAGSPTLFARCRRWLREQQCTNCAE